MTNAVRGVRAADVWDLARTLYGEARGETQRGRIAVAWTVRNRLARPGWWSRHPDDGIPDDTVQAVCREPAQYSCWNRTDPNAGLLAALTLPDALSDPAMRACLAAAIAVLDGVEPDPTEGSCHYHTVAVSPAWTRGRQPVCRIGAHLFYNDIP